MELDGTGEWTNKYTFWECYRYSYTPATDKEVEEALIKEAKRRGFENEGVEFVNTFNGTRLYLR